MEWDGEGKEMEWKKWVNNDFVKWICKWNRMEMGMEWNGIFGGISPRGEW